VYAPFYDRVFGRVLQQGRRCAIEHLSLLEGGRLLEVGVGTGLMLPMYPPQWSVVGVDVSPEMLDVARSRVRSLGLRNVRLSQMDGAALSFRDDAFDAVVAAYVVTAAPDPSALLDEMIRVCRPGGRLLIINHFRKSGVRGVADRMLSPLLRYAGFRTDLGFADTLDRKGLQVCSSEPVNPFSISHLVECVKADGHVNSTARD
jgi:phosphatidylethanolamine/phosphatidyl-N-methylethanolamine N-methyltransferase